MHPRISSIAPSFAPAIVQEKVGARRANSISCNDHCVCSGRVLGRKIANDPAQPVVLGNESLRIEGRTGNVHGHPNILSLRQNPHEREAVMAYPCRVRKPGNRIGISPRELLRVDFATAIVRRHPAGANFSAIRFALRFLHPTAGEYLIHARIRPKRFGRERSIAICVHRQRHRRIMVSRPDVHDRNRPIFAIAARKRMVDCRRKRKGRTCTNNTLLPHRPLGPVFAVVHDGRELGRSRLCRCEAKHGIGQQRASGRRDIGITGLSAIHGNLFGTDLDISASRARRQSLHTRWWGAGIRKRSGRKRARSLRRPRGYRGRPQRRSEAGSGALINVCGLRRGDRRYLPAVS